MMSDAQAPLPLMQDHCTAKVSRASPQQIEHWLKQLSGWHIHQGELVGDFSFSDFDATMAFVNTVAALARQENHHPDMAISYNRCRVSWSTHSVGALSRNDFICAARLSRTGE